MSELLREIEDDIKRERYDRLWNSFGKVMVGVSVVVVLITIGVVVWQNHRQEHAMEKTSEFIKGIDRLNIEDYKGAIVVFDALAEDASAPYYPLSLLRKAQAQNALSDHEGAYKTYQLLADKDPVFGQLGRLMLPPNGKDVTRPQLGVPFFYAQSEARGWQLLNLGEKDNAAAQFAAIYRDEKAPHSMHARVMEALQYLAPELLAKEDAAIKAAEGKHDE